MFDHVFEYITTHGLLETLSVGIIPSVLLVTALILVLKLIEMNRDDYDGVYKSISKRAKREKQASDNKKLQEKFDAMQDRLTGESKVNHLRDRVARLKAADEERKSRYGKE